MPLIEGVWPPPPLRDEPPPLFLRVEGMQITRSGDRLVILNISIRRLFLVEVCILSTSLLLPWISFWTNPFHHAALPGLLPYVISSYRVTYWLYLFMLCLLAGIWCWFTFQFNLGGITLDRGEQLVKAGGRRAHPMSRIESVQIKPTPNTSLGLHYFVSFTWSGGRPASRWRRAWTSLPTNTCLLGYFRQEANAEAAAATIAEFANVSVQQKVDENPVSV